MKHILMACLIIFSWQSIAEHNDYIVKLKAHSDINTYQIQSHFPLGTKVNDLEFNNWVQVTLPESVSIMSHFHLLKQNPSVEYVQPNYKIKLYDNPSLAQKPMRPENCPEPIPEEFCDILFPPDDGSGGGGGGGSSGDNPAIPDIVTNPDTGSDPLIDKQWGMIDIGTQEIWDKGPIDNDIVVAVIDTGVDYTHEDLVGNLWRNPGETGTDENGKDKATNGIDDDGNGFVDDVIGWDFVSNDNKPYDLKGGAFGGNPGHGTHCAGNVGARGGNGIGISGVAQNVQIMTLRFLSEKGSGTTAGAVKSIKYAVDNGAHITSNSWGSVGENPNDAEGNRALREIITYSQEKNTLFIAAAGNGKQGRGYNNDTDSQPAYPASYDMENIISVAAIDSSDRLGSFSNWGRKTVDIGAPGVKVFSTTVGNGYSDSVGGFGTWDGTSMAAPHVSGAAALYWAMNPNKSWREVKDAILNSAKPISALRGKATSEGKLSVSNLINSN